MSHRTKPRRRQETLNRGFGITSSMEAPMKVLCLGLALGMTVFYAVAARAQDPAILAQSKGCMTCHDVSKAKMGPSFSQIAAQYKGQADAATKLAGVLKNGTGGHMKVSASDAELQQIIAYVLATP